MLFADKIKNAGLLETVSYGPVESREDKRDGFLMERLDQLGEHSYAGDIYMVERLSVENQPPYRGWCARDRLSNAPLDIVRVREEQAIIEPVDEHSRNDCGRRVQPDVGVPVQSLHPAEYCVVRSRAAAHRVDDRERDSQ